MMRHTSSTLLAAFIFAVALAGFGSTALTAGETPEADAPTPPSIRVVAAEKRNLIETLSVTGTIVPHQKATVGTDLNGLTVTQLNVDQGDRVEKGQVLAVLDRSSLDTQLAQLDASRVQAEASVEQVRAQIADANIAVRQATETLDRAKALQVKGVATKAEFDNALNAFDSANAKQISAEKALDGSQAQLGVIDAQKQVVMLQIAKTEVKAPADGLVLARNATLGSVVSAAGGPLFRIAIDGRFELAADIPETSLPRLAEGMKATINVAGSEQVISGHVRLISPEIDQKSRLGSIRIALAENSVARSGNFARGEIETETRDGVAVPVSAIIYKGRDAFLQRVDDGRVSTVAVDLGVRADGFVEVNDGLNAGDEVVSRAGTFVANGDMVTPVRDENTGAIKP